jgi:hypothetical protein
MKALFGLLVVVLAGYLAFAFMPPYFAKYKFADDITSIARFDGPTTKGEEEIRQEVLKKAKEEGVPVTGEQIQITREGQHLDIKAKYTHVVSLIGGKQVPLEFAVQSEK